MMRGKRKGRLVELKEMCFECGVLDRVRMRLVLREDRVKLKRFY